MSLFNANLYSLFNIVFNTGRVPEVWTKGFIDPIYKKKGIWRTPIAIEE